MNEREGLDTIFGKLDEIADNDELKPLLTSPLLMEVRDSDVVQVAFGLYKLGRKEMCKQLLHDYTQQLLETYLKDSMKKLADAIRDDEILVVHARVDSEARYSIQFEIVQVSEEDKEKEILKQITSGNLDEELLSDITRLLRELRASAKQGEISMAPSTRDADNFFKTHEAYKAAGFTEMQALKMALQLSFVDVYEEETERDLVKARIKSIMDVRV